MTKQEFNELKRLAMFFWNQANLLEKDGDNRLQAEDVMDWMKKRAQADIYRSASTLLSMKLEHLQGNRMSGSNTSPGKRAPAKKLSN